MRRYEITDPQWQRVAHLLPGKIGDVGQSAADNHLFINAVLGVAHSGAPWRDLPDRFGRWHSVYRRFRRWAKAGVWQNVFEQLQEPDLDWLMINSIVVRAHQHAAGQKSNPASECSGQSVAGWSTQIHVAVDALGKPLRLILTVGQRADITQAEALIVGYQTDAVSTDRGYDASSLVDTRQKAAVNIVIPAKKSRLEQRAIDANLYNDRNKVERYFNKLKQYRRVATRYEKTASSFAGFVYLASAMLLLVQLSTHPRWFSTFLYVW